MAVEKYLKPSVINQIKRLDLRAQFVVKGFLHGLHASPFHGFSVCLLYTSPSPRDKRQSRMPSSA